MKLIIITLLMSSGLYANTCEIRQVPDGKRCVVSREVCNYVGNQRICESICTRYDTVYIYINTCDDRSQ